MLGSAKLAAILGATLCLLAVAIGAFGAHAWSALLIENQRLDTFELANRYHFYHGLALLVIASFNQASAIHNKAFKNAKLSVLCLFSGTLIFSLSLYLLALTNLSYLGAITPIGGLLLLVGWALLLIQFIRS